MNSRHSLAFFRAMIADAGAALAVFDIMATALLTTYATGVSANSTDLVSEL